VARLRAMRRKRCFAAHNLYMLPIYSDTGVVRTVKQAGQLILTPLGSCGKGCCKLPYIGL
jgi:hypothetical protein